MTIEDWAYIAGYFDGEGHIGGSKTHTGWTNFHTNIQTCDIETLEWIHKTTGLGAFNITPTLTVTGRRQGRFYTNKKAHSIAFLTGMLPYLKNKKSQAVLTLEALSFEVDQTKVNRWHPFNPHKERIEQIRIELINIKKNANKVLS